MVTVAEADAIILKDINILPAVTVPLSESVGKILREDLIADRDLPPFDRVAMDGIAIDFSMWQKGRVTFDIEAVQKAGSPQLTLKCSDACIEVMTGAMLPNGCDCVIPVENITVVDGVARLRESFKLKHMQNIHQQASDYPQGNVLVQKGCRLLSPQIAVAASVGKSEVCVSYDPSIVIISTGDELVDVDREVKLHQIRLTNAYAIEAALNSRSYQKTTRFHILDDKEELIHRLQEIVSRFDIVILSGGVSMGKFDYVPDILKELGVSVLFHKVQQSPGKPFWFGKTKQDKSVFALPGNPVATQIGVYRHVLPYLERVTGCENANDLREWMTLSEDIKVKTPFTYFLPVKILNGEDHTSMVAPIHTNGSGDFASLAQSDGFIELPPETHHFPVNTRTRFYRW